MLWVSLRAGSGAVLGKGLYTLYPCIYVEMDKDGVFSTTAVLPHAIKYTVVAKWRSPADAPREQTGCIAATKLV